MAYRITIVWDAADAVPFGTEYVSHVYPDRTAAWQYVQRICERAAASGVQLHNILVWTCTPKRGLLRTCVWCKHDPRLSGDPWPTR